MGGFEKLAKKVDLASSTTASSNKVDEESKDCAVRINTKDLLDLEEDNVLFKDFTEPDLMKTGYLIPLKCGHNGQLSVNEKTIYEIHLTNAGFIHEDNQRSSDMDDS